jgi:hypothetical protein
MKGREDYTVHAAVLVMFISGERASPLLPLWHVHVPCRLPAMRQQHGETRRPKLKDPIRSAPWLHAHCRRRGSDSCRPEATALAAMPVSLSATWPAPRNPKVPLQRASSIGMRVTWPAGPSTRALHMRQA